MCTIFFALDTELIARILASCVLILDLSRWILKVEQTQLGLETGIAIELLMSNQ